MKGQRGNEQATSDLEYRQLLSIFESIDEPIYVSDPETGEVLYINDTLRREFGDVTGHKCHEVFQGLELPCEDCPNDEIFGENLGKAHHRESLQPRNNRWYRGISRAIRWPDGRLVRYEMGIDITDRKLAEAALEESEHKYRSLVENVPDIIYALDAQGRLTSINEGGLNLLGYDSDELLGHHFTAFIHPDDQEMTVDAFQKALTTGRQGPRGLTFRVLKRNGEAVWVSLNSNMTFDEDGEFLEEHGVARDITQRKRVEEEKQRYEEQLRQTQKLESLCVMASGFAHDFNNLLMSILGNVGVALANTPESSPSHENLINIKNVTRKATEMAGQMLAYAGKGGFNVQPLDLNEVIREMAPHLEESTSKTIAIHYDLAAELPSVKADPTHVRQVVTGLLTNAAEAIGDDRGFVLISTQAADRLPNDIDLSYVDEGAIYDGFVSLEVSDTGCGMDEETAKKIFDPFYSTKFTGRGMGLAAVLGIIRRNHGAVAVRSIVGEGTEFAIYLPATDVPAEKSRPLNAEVPIWRGSGTILVVDDEESVRNAVKIMLQFGGFDVITASDGEEALHVFERRSEEIKLIVLDLTMPRMSGDEVLRQLEKIRRDIKVLLSSGLGEQDVLERFRDRRSVAFIQKPYRLDQLLERIRTMLKEE